MPRVVACLACNVVEKLADPPQGVRYVDAVLQWYEGSDLRTHTITNPETGVVVKVPEYDPLMEDFTYRHQHGKEPIEVMNAIKVWETDMKTFLMMDMVETVKVNLAEQQNAQVTEANYYKDEALKCYNAHGNPDLKDGCRDFRDDSKRIGSKADNPEHQMHICHMCPYAQTYIAQELRWRAGAYGNNVPVTIGPKAKAALKKRGVGKTGNRRQRRAQR